MLGERKSSMCRSRVARGHFTLMAAGPIEMTAALHDLKVRRQRIIFQWWRRRIGGVKWCLPTTPPLLFPLLPLLNYCRTTKMESTQHQTSPSLLLHTAHRETHSIAPVFSAPVHHDEKFCCGKFRRSVWETKQHNKPPYSTLTAFHYAIKLYL